MSAMEGCEQENFERQALRSILSSGTFEKSPNLAKILTYICEKYWDGNTQELKEYNLAVDALGRPSDFDPSTDAIVRVEAYRLREKLKKYYEAQGASEPVLIVLRPGSYVPHFEMREANGQASSPEKVTEARPHAAPRAGPAIIRDNSQGKEKQISDVDNPGRFTRFARHAISNWPTVAIVLFTLILAGISSHFLLHPHDQPGQGASPSVPTQALSTSALASQKSIYMIAGYLRKYYIDRSGNVWSGDEFFQGGTAGSSGTQFISRTSDPTLFQTYRQGNFSYNIPLKPGIYELRLYFAETTYGPGTLMGGGETSRTFNVVVNGHTILDHFDIIADAPGVFIADVRAFKGITPAPDGQLHIQFVRLTSVPLVDAIQIIPIPDGRLSPIRMVAQNNSYTDNQGLKWDPDTYCQGGRLVIHRTSVVGTPDPGLYKSERYGNFRYAIPVARGKYGLKLYFSEQYFGPENPGVGGPGSRVFNVTCNGKLLLRHFDIFKEAGGANRALVKTFHGLTANPQGKLDIDFIPAVNYASVNALQVVDESPGTSSP